MADDTEYAHTPPNQQNAYGPSKPAAWMQSDLDQGWIGIGRLDSRLKMNAKRLGVSNPEDVEIPDKEARGGSGT